MILHPSTTIKIFDIRGGVVGGILGLICLLGRLWWYRHLHYHGQHARA